MRKKNLKNNIACCVVILCCIVSGGIIASCANEEEKTVQVNSEISYLLDKDENQLVVEIPCLQSWTITGAEEWCVPSITSGQGKTSVSIQVEANSGEDIRKCWLSAVSEDARHIIKITQYGDERTILPIVFHVLYTDPNDSRQYLNADYLAELLEVANGCYMGKFGGVDLEVKLVLATETPTGGTLATPGVNYVYRENAVMDCHTFMYDNSGKYVKLLWDPNRYINIMCYPFLPDENENGILMGSSHFPFTNPDTYLPELPTISSSYLGLENLKYPHCVSMNSSYIYSESMRYTLAHELGHYLGLYHVFSEGDDDMCIDSDYCDDTPSYNREDYLRYIEWAAQNLPYGEYLYELRMRESCDGEQFRSVNVMDYNDGARNQFTADQRARVRHVLRYSPLLPTERNARIQRSSLHDGPLDLPIVVMD